jgi:hypothetical protein
MSSYATRDRLRAHARVMADPADQALLERLADLHELDERRRQAPAGSAERAELDERIAARAHDILDHGMDPD